MTRAWFGGSVADFVIAAAAPDDPLRPASGVLTLWDAEEGGDQYDDLLYQGEPVESILVGYDGQIPSFQGPDDVLKMWAQVGTGPRVLIVSLGGSVDRADDAAGDAELSAAAALAYRDAASEHVAEAVLARTGAEEAADRGELYRDDAEAASVAASGSAAAALADKVAAELARDQAQAFASTAAPAIYTQRALNPIFQTDTSGWTVTNGTLTRVSPGHATFTVTLAGATNASIYLYGAPGTTFIPITPGQYLTSFIRFTALRDLQCTVIVNFMDATNAATGTLTFARGEWTTVNAGETANLGYADAVAPAGTVKAYLRLVIFDKGQSTAAAADFLDVLGGNAYVSSQRRGWSVADLPLLYGGMTGVRWTGTAHNSTSEIYAPPASLLSAIARGGTEVHGAGTPEGRLYAPLGTRYVQEDALGGPVQWVKTTAVTSTIGWRITSGDTGWRDFAPPTGWALAASLPMHQLRRIDDKVYLRARISPSGSTIGQNRTTNLLYQFNIPSGWLPATDSYTHAGTWVRGAPAWGALARLASYARVDMYSVANESGTWQAADIVSMTAEWLAGLQHVWPTA